MGKLQLELGYKPNLQEAHRIKQFLSNKKGVLKVSIEEEGTMKVEWNPHEIKRSEIIKIINEEGLSILQLKIEENENISKKEDSHSHSHAHAPITF
ncbi:MAG TPA: hypothetical protein VKX31_03445, partial [Brumimicrobium sp.]|nr:hypothetical protein [Brumimicrobium sp.]